MIVSWVTMDEPGSNTVLYWSAYINHSKKAQDKVTTYKYYNYTSRYIHHCTINNLKVLLLPTTEERRILCYLDGVTSPCFTRTVYIPIMKQLIIKHTKILNEDVIDNDLLEDMVCHIDETYPEGAILMFLPGVLEIHMLLDKLAVSYRFGGLSAEWLLPLHSSIASADQKKVFLRPPDNILKVIIATNIAETSITIDDVVYVVECGKHKENRYNPKGDLGRSYDSNQTLNHYELNPTNEKNVLFVGDLSYVDNYPNHDNTRYV